MKYLNGQLRNEQDSTLCMPAYTQNMTVEEYVPVVALVVLLASLLGGLLLA